MAKSSSGPSYEAKKKHLLDLLAEGWLVADALHHLNWNENTFYSMRRKDRAWDAAIKEYTGILTGPGASSSPKSNVFDPDRELPDKGSFTEWRMKYLGRPTAPHHQAIADAVMDTTNHRVIILMPPGAGKDTTVGDLLLHIKCDDRDYLRCAWIMQNANLSLRRVSERLRPYLEDPRAYQVPPPDTPGGNQPTGSLIDDFGPFKWRRGLVYPDKSPVLRTTWTKNELRFLASAAAPEADPDIWATGIDGELYGSRVGLMVWSDLFTRENQLSDTEKAKQFSWLTLTALSRLDANGRLIVIGTRVMDGDNYERLIDFFAPAGTPIHRTTHNGPVTVIKYANGTCVIEVTAIWTDEDGNDQSYWEDRFPLLDRWQLPDQTMVPIGDMSIDEALAARAVRYEGLTTMRERDPDTFDTAYMQSPPANSTLSDFTDAILDVCSDPTLTYGHPRPNDILVQCVDPARAGGAAVVMLAVETSGPVIRVVDENWYTNLGIQGIKKRLITDPAMKWRPHFIVYEANHEQGVLYDSEIQKMIQSVGATVVTQHTNKNRADRAVGVASITQEMRAGIIRFPTATPGDKARTARIRSHFKNWDISPQAHRSNRTRLARPDDLCMAIWLGVIQVRSLLERAAASERPKTISNRIPPSVMRRWYPRHRKTTQVSTNRQRVSYGEVDVVKLYLGEYGDAP